MGETCLDGRVSLDGEVCLEGGARVDKGISLSGGISSVGEGLRLITLPGVLGGGGTLCCFQRFVFSLYSQPSSAGSGGSGKTSMSPTGRPAISDGAAGRLLLVVAPDARLLLSGGEDGACLVGADGK